ncbi:jg27900 [Pararge aegeria aegeria]|uniref:Jg27900 protein n=1 Tax=Pararge aegeria aegeria TaxID=348720 RepID=A0A8S4SP60_9NEOP|nr:jg27900 [Pararge aegeria aegeria]
MEIRSLTIAILVSLEIVLAAEPNTNSLDEEKYSTRILSRRKRFLIFPDGSSFQLVFCAQNQGYLQLGDIVWFGNTAALAWELPTDPELLLKLKKHDKLSYTAQNRDGVSKLLYYLDEKGNVLSKVPFRKKIIVNPAFAKRSVDEHLAYLDELSATTIKELHIKQKSLRVFDDLDENAVNFHRRGRQSLYGQLETFIQAIGWTGRECVLRLLCESGKGSADQGTFLEEIFRATFTLPKRRKSDGDLYRDYNEAHNAKGDCPSLYPQCKQTVKKYI